MSVARPLGSSCSMRSKNRSSGMPSALARNSSHDMTSGSSIFGAPCIMTTWRRCGRFARSLWIFCHCASFSTRTTFASQWCTMYCTSGGEHVA